METLIYILIYGAAGYGIYRYLHSRERVQDQEQVRYTGKRIKVSRVKHTQALHTRLEMLSAVDAQLVAVKDMIVEVETSSPEYTKVLHLTRHTAAGGDIDVQILVNGKSDATYALLDLLEAREEELAEWLDYELSLVPFPERRKLFSRIRHRQNVDKTEALISRGVTDYEDETRTEPIIDESGEESGE